MADEGRRVAEYDDAEQDEDEEDGEEEGSDDEGELDADGEDDGAPTGNGRPSVAELFGDDDEDEEEDSEFDLKQYPSAVDFDVYALHRAAEEGDVVKLAGVLERFGEKGERRDLWGLTPLHSSVMSCNFECFSLLLDWKNSSLDATLQGSPLPHIILSIASISKNAEFGLKALRALLGKGAATLMSQSKDDFDRTALRLACELALEKEFIEVLLDAFDAAPDSEEKGQALTSSDKIKKWNALHAAADVKNSTRREEIMNVLLSRGKFGDVVNYFDMYSRTSLHVLVRNTGLFSDSDLSCSLLLKAGVNKSLKDALGKEASDYVRQGGRTRRGPTFIYSHEKCAKHYTAPAEDTKKAWFTKKDIPPENVNRLLVLLNEKFGTLHSRRILVNGQHETEPPKAQIGDVLRVHDWGYVDSFREKCDELEDEEEMGELDGDTSFSKLTYEASLLACGSAIEAIDRVVSGKSENAFCAMRPPGHHAGPSGLCPGCTSHGFCFLNTVAVASAYAMDRHRDKIKRIAIVDFDVHHGNGTEVCVENLLPNMVKGKFDLPMGGEMSVSRPSYKPWLGEGDIQNILFCSVHGFGKAVPGMNPDPRSPPFLPSFYPGSGKDRGWTEGSPILNVGQNSSSRLEWRQNWRKIVLPRVIQFKPDLILVSAGFDAHAKDFINGGFCGALEPDYEWITQQLIATANEVCDGRLVSILEGGYKIQGMCVSAFARSVAEHVRVLTESDPSFRISPLEVKWEIDELEKQIKAAKEADVEKQRITILNARAAGSTRPTVGSVEKADKASAASMDGDEVSDIEQEEREVEEVLEVEQSEAQHHSLASESQGDRPRRRTARDIDFVKLNEEINKEKETKRARIE